MNNKAPSKRSLGMLFFTAGTLLGVALMTVITWANFEASFYGFQRMPGEHLDGLVCPTLMTPRETANVQIQVNNPSKKTIEPTIRIDVSTPGMPDTTELQIRIDPGRTEQLNQPVTADNIDLGFFIFAKAYRSPSYPLPNAEATCGIFIIDVPVLNGAQLFIIWLTISLVLIPSGLWMWSTSLHPEGAGRLVGAANALAVIVLVGLLVSLRGVWALGLLFLVLAVLTALAMLRFAVSK